MIYPSDFELRLGFDRIRQQTEALLNTNGAVELLYNSVGFESNFERVVASVGRVNEMLMIINSSRAEFSLSEFRDINAFLPRIRVEGTFLESDQMLELLSALELLGSIRRFFVSVDQDRQSGSEPIFPLLVAMGEHIGSYDDIVNQISSIVDKYGRVKDSASSELGRIRRAIIENSSQISKKLHHILKLAQSEGYAESDSQPSIRDGRAVLPIIAGSKRKIKGLVHSESATGKTAFIEPIEVVELNNLVRELENDERREIVRILIMFADQLRPRIDDLLVAGEYMLEMELIVAKAHLAKKMNAIMPDISAEPMLELIQARHPLLEQALRQEGKQLVPLDIRLTKDKHILLISGPNAGGKSVCLKTVGLLQYMLQCGYLIPSAVDSQMGIFDSLFVDIGDQQSIDNDLSTYSSHLLNMKTMLQRADSKSMILIDEFGSGTEPTTGGAIAESILEKLNDRGVFGVITTHYANLKYYASNAVGIENGAMTFDVQNITPLFKLEMGHAGSSFAFEIARKIGLPESIIESASHKIGTDQIDLERQLKRVQRDRRYWESKRERIRSAEKGIDKTAAQYEQELSQIQVERNKIIGEAKLEAQKLVADANRKIENTIREIKESSAEKERTRIARSELNTFKALLYDQMGQEVEVDDPIQRKIKQLREKEQRRQQRKAENQAKKENTEHNANEPRINEAKEDSAKELQVGFKVRIQGQSVVGEVVSISGNKIKVSFGSVITTVDKSKIEIVKHSEYRKLSRSSSSSSSSVSNSLGGAKVSTPTVSNYNTHDQRLTFSQRLDVRGMRASDALQAVEKFLDEAIMHGFSEISILHGKGTGALKQQIRQYLNCQPVVRAAIDEHEEFGGAGITVVKLDL